MNADRPVDNAPYHSLTHGGLTVEGWSRAAVQSYWRVPELKVGFDLGASPWDFMGTPTWFVSHTHLDHVAALPVYVARRRMMKMEPPTVYVPAEGLDDVKKLMAVMHRLDRGRQLADVRPLAPGDEIELNREQVVTVVNTAHTVPSRGFIVSERRRKLKPEFVGLPGEKIKELRLSGVEITREERIPLVAYTGDTAPAGLDNNPAFFEAKILITEMSFIRASHRRDKIHKFGHMHLDDFVERAGRFNNEVIVTAHFSTRYHPNEVRKLLDNKLPPELKAKMKLWV
ncbi:MBL fold metallo-hydrolase [Gemmata sp.]|uniref:MBL fold metallo-hydrolase n=1 Tax=Gemmata sp. TaxID=1914242 RepID=UPI003F7009E9